MLPSSCACAQLQRFMQQLHERVSVVETNIASVASATATHCQQAEVETLRIAVDARLTALENTAQQTQQALVIPDDMLRYVMFIECIHCTHMLWLLSLCSCCQHEAAREAHAD